MINQSMHCITCTYACRLYNGEGTPLIMMLMFSPSTQLVLGTVPPKHSDLVTLGPTDVLPRRDSATTVFGGAWTPQKDAVRILLIVCLFEMSQSRNIHGSKCRKV
jgi:hypothetical protein